MNAPSILIGGPPAVVCDTNDTSLVQQHIRQHILLRQVSPVVRAHDVMYRAVGCTARGVKLLGAEHAGTWHDRAAQLALAEQ